MTTLLVTGAGGFVGSHVVERALAVTDWDIVCMDSFRHNGITDRVAAAANGSDRVTVITHDLTAPVSALTADRIGPVDYVINAASGCSVDESVRDPAAFVMNNCAIGVNMLEYARTAIPGCAFLHVSTDEVYGPWEPRASTDHRPSSPYAASKAAQEDLCHAYRRTYGLNVGVFNSANMFGERQSTLAFIPRLIRAAITREEITVHTPGSRRYTYVRNTAAVLCDLLVNGLTEASQEMPRFQLPGQHHVSNQELAEMVAHEAGKPIQMRKVSAHAARPGHDENYASLRHGKVEQELPYSFSEGLQRTVQWGLANPEWVLT